MRRPVVLMMLVWRRRLAALPWMMKMVTARRLKVSLFLLLLLLISILFIRVFLGCLGFQEQVGGRG